MKKYIKKISRPSYRKTDCCVDAIKRVRDERNRLRELIHSIAINLLSNHRSFENIDIVQEAISTANPDCEVIISITPCISGV